MKWITAEDIECWASRESRKAQETLPLLVWKLILASTNKINDHHFPFGNSIQYSGYDGFLDTDDESPYFPRGKSVWEIGTNENALDKFNDDYNKRTNSPNGIDQSSTAFCFVTSRRWKYKKGIAETTEEKNQERIWKSVRIIDANNIAMWLEHCPSVHIWFSSIIGLPHLDVQDICSFWKETVDSTNPQLSSALLMYKREPYVKKLQSVYEAAMPKQIVLVGDSRLEAILCVAAEIATSEDVSVATFGSKIVIAHTYEALNEFDSHFSHALIIPAFSISSKPPSIHRNTLILPVDRYSPLERLCKSDCRVEIPPRTRHEFCESVETLGYETGEAFQLGQKLHCSFPALFRFLQTDLSKKTPEWSQNKDCINLIPALLVGAWEEKSIGDTEIISSLSGLQYHDYLQSINPFLKGENAPLFSLDRSYACIYVREMWDFLWSKILPKHFASFKECFLKVFAENDPTYDLPENKWLMAELYGKKPAYSNRLKENLIVTLIMMIEQDRSTPYSSFSNNISKECEHLVTQAFEQIHSLAHLLTICPYIPLLIEAVPDTILGILEHEAENPESDIWALFISSKHSLFGRNLYAHLLWALEKALWDSTYAVRALNLLIIFSEKKFSYSQTNSPIDTLSRVFCIWYPQGIFSNNERKTLLKSIITKHKSIAPALVNALLSTGTQITTDISKPIWKPIEADQVSVTCAEYNDMRSYIASTYINAISPCYDDWRVVFSNILAFDDISEIAAICQRQVVDMTEEDVLSLCKDITHYISHSRKYGHDLNKRVDMIEEMYISILPSTPKYFAHYFSDHFDGLNPIPYNSAEYDYAEAKRCLYAFQKEKITEMVERFGIDSIVEVSPLIENQSAFATAVVEVTLHGSSNWKLIQKIRETNPCLASSVVSAIYQINGIRSILDEEGVIDASDIGWALSSLPLTEETTTPIFESKSELCRKAFWENVSVWGLSAENSNWINKCIAALLEFKRPYSIINSLSHSEWSEPEIVFDVLSAAMAQFPNPEPSGLQLSQIGAHSIECFFKKLYAKQILPESKVAELEFAYLAAFSMDFEPKCLVNQLLINPELYFELVTLAFRSDDEDDNCFVASQNGSARVAHIALNRIRRIPGMAAESNAIDELHFEKWIADTHNLALKNHYLDAHEIILGNILSYAPIGKDGFWPAECVRNVFEQPHSETLTTHFIIGKENQRGVHIVTAGAEEAEIANYYKRQASGIQLLYPKTAAILLRISEEYYAEAKAERVRELKGDF